ncbi:hypothetical protein QEZ54_19740 [Catellatospora sp. KI3]|uniref:hypothetical protein n=1 Tax=Catellatospora sp. KI3 TaxID=3041620 RepID=UPI002482F03D|nr:hypothetical protein [Catellatospora sp. KI3]MDI1463217.1 hypothetical protein [Catellatospora sp. KI3]
MTVRKRRLSVLLTVLVAAVALVVDAAPAQAGAAEAVNRCDQGLVPEIDTTVTVRANGGGSFPAEAAPRNLIEQGDVFYVIPLTGPGMSTANMGGGTGSYGPDGNGQPAPSGWPFPGFAQYSSVLRFNNNPAGWVGNPAAATGFNRCVRWFDSFPMRLLFYVNDTYQADNSGGWDFRILVYKASAVATTAMDNCWHARAPQAAETIFIQGNGGGSFPSGGNPPNAIAAGNVFSVSASYWDKVGMGWGAPSVGPYGDSIPAPGNWPFPQMLQYSAIQRFNNNPGGWVGNPEQAALFGGCHVWTSSLPVRLLFYVNDTYTGDNSGAWRFDVRVYR